MAFSDERTYTINCRVSDAVVHDRPVMSDEPGATKENIELHVRADDYFPMMSTILSFLEETIELCSPRDALTEAQLRAIQASRKDLAYLHKHYRIVPKE